MRLSELKTGERGVIAKVYGTGSFRKRIVEMGFIKGKTVKVVLNAPLHDPIVYEIIGYKISLRREEANMIEIISDKTAATNNIRIIGSLNFSRKSFHKGVCGGGVMIFSPNCLRLCCTSESFKPE